MSFFSRLFRRKSKVENIKKMVKPIISAPQPAPSSRGGHADLMVGWLVMDTIGGTNEKADATSCESATSTTDSNTSSDCGGGGGGD